jgi:preprotein translocase subunit SecA
LEITYSVLRTIKTSVGLRSYGQRDPLVEYKKEAFDLFSSLLEKLKFDYITVLMNLKVIEQPRQENDKNKEPEILNNPKCLLILKKDQKISRNDRCEATGKKFKQCCGAL